MIAQGRAGRVEPDGGQEGKEERCRRRWARQRQRRQDADDGGDDRRPRRGVRRRPGFRSSGSAAVPRGVEPRAGRGGEGAAGGRRESECQGAGRRDAAASGRAGAAGRRSFARSSAAGAKLDAVNKDNLTPLLLAEKPEPPPPPGNNTDPRTYRPKRDSREDVIAARARADGARAERSGASSRRRCRRGDDKKDDEEDGRRRGRSSEEGCLRRAAAAHDVESMSAALSGAGGQPSRAAQRRQPRPQSAIAAAPARSPAPARSQRARSRPRRRRRQPPHRTDAPKHRAWVKQYCVGCHNSRTASPANEPVNLETASLDDLVAARGDVGARAAQAERARDAAAGHAAPDGSRVRRRSRPGSPARSIARWAGQEHTRAATSCIA